MVERAELYPGFKVGDLKLIQRVHASANAPSWAKKKWRVECICGKRLTVAEYYLTRKPNPKTHCGCKLKTNKTIFNEEFRIWCMMRQRCYTSTHVAYKHYGGRGIEICKEWLDPDTGFEQFLKDVGPRPSPGHSIDRIDPDGHYELRHRNTGQLQIRWATAKEQGQTTRAAIARQKAKETKT